jgi:hypothetical protein
MWGDTMTRRWLATALTTSVIAVAALTGCGGDPAPSPSGAAAPSSPAPASAVTTAAGDAEGPADADPGSAAFIAAVRQQLPAIGTDRRDEEIAAIAEQACAGLSAGLTGDQIVAETRTLGTEDASATDQATARELIKLAIDKVCPNEAKRVDEF